MGCNTSVNSDVEVTVTLNSPFFKVETLTEKSTLRTSLKDFCRKVINSNLNPTLNPRSLTFQVFHKGKEYSLKDHTHLYDLRLTSEEDIKITAIRLDQRTFELTLKFCTSCPREEKKEVNQFSLVSSLLPKGDFKVLLGHLQLDYDQTLEDYDVYGNTRLIVVEDFEEFPDIQAWKIKKSGLVLEALCMNLGCKAYKQRICINLGLGEFNISSEVSQDNCRSCESCDSTLGAVCKVSFVHCIVNYTIKDESGVLRDVAVRVKNCLEDSCKTWQSNIKITKFI